MGTGSAPTTCTTVRSVRTAFTHNTTNIALAFNGERACTTVCHDSIPSICFNAIKPNELTISRNSLSRDHCFHCYQKVANSTLNDIAT